MPSSSSPQASAGTQAAPRQLPGAAQAQGCCPQHRPAGMHSIIMHTWSRGHGCMPEQRCMQHAPLTCCTAPPRLTPCAAASVCSSACIAMKAGKSPSDACTRASQPLCQNPSQRCSPAYMLSIALQPHLEEKCSRKLRASSRRHSNSRSDRGRTGISAEASMAACSWSAAPTRRAQLLP